MPNTLNAAIIVQVDTQLVERLLALNRTFYAEFAGAFSGTRSSAQSNLNRIVTYISPGVKALDIGCGNGRLAQKLDQAGLDITYLGVDFSAGLIELARSAPLRRVNAAFCVADVTHPGWSQSLPGAPFDVAVMLAALHHIPSFDLRRDVLRDIGAVLRPGGLLIMTNWQFTRNERLRKKIVAWQTVGIDERDLETGDALLDWKRGGTGYRYCHLLTEGEVERMAAQSGLDVVEQFHADADLNLYSLLRSSQARDVEK